MDVQTESHANEVLHMFLALFVKMVFLLIWNGLFDLEIDFLTYKMTLSHKNNTGNGLPRQNHMKMR